MKKELLVASESTRRQFAAQLAKGFLGVSILPTLSTFSFGADAKPGKAKHVIYLFMNGAMSHLDTFDPKPGADTQGATKAIKTTTTGVQLSEHFPQLAKNFKHAALVRSLSTETGAHQQGRYLMRTSYKEIASTSHPSLGAWTAKLQGKLNAELPPNVLIGNGTQHPGSGFLEAKYSPVPIGDPEDGLQNTKGPSYLKENQFEKRMALATQFDRTFQKRYPQRQVGAYTQLYNEAIQLLNSKDLEVFDLEKEPAKTRTAFGENEIGQGLLLARRLVEKGVRYIDVVCSSWDDHRDLWENLPDRAKAFDQALATLLTDLQSKGLLDDTLVVVASEFGRSPKINANGGRDHHPGVFSGLFAGGGIKGGQVYGSSDEEGFAVEDDPTTVQDFNATIAYALGLPLEEEQIAPSGRPFKVAADGIPLKSLFV